MDIQPLNQFYWIQPRKRSRQKLFGLGAADLRLLLLSLSDFLFRLTSSLVSLMSLRRFSSLKGFLNTLSDVILVSAFGFLELLIQRVNKKAF